MRAHPFPSTIRDNLLRRKNPHSSPTRLTSNQTAFVLLDEVIKMVNRRGRLKKDVSFHSAGTDAVHSQRNVLQPSHDHRVGYESNLSHSEHVIIPRTENTIKCVYSDDPLALPSWTTDLDFKISTRNWTSWTEKSSTVSKRFVPICSASTDRG